MLPGLLFSPTAGLSSVSRQTRQLRQDLPKSCVTWLFEYYLNFIRVQSLIYTTPSIEVEVPYWSFENEPLPEQGEKEAGTTTTGTTHKLCTRTGSPSSSKGPAAIVQCRAGCSLASLSAVTKCHFCHGTGASAGKSSSAGKFMKTRKRCWQGSSPAEQHRSVTHIPPTFFFFFLIKNRTRPRSNPGQTLTVGIIPSSYFQLEGCPDSAASFNPINAFHVHIKMSPIQSVLWDRYNAFMGTKHLSSA